MQISELSQAVRSLAIKEPNDDIIVSCYLDLTDPQWGSFLQAQIANRPKALPAEQRHAFLQITSQIQNFLSHNVTQSAKGLAIFARVGSDPFFESFHFNVSPPNWIGIDFYPSIYHLVEMKDVYHRYVILLSSKTSGRIVEVNMGRVTQSLWTEKEEYRERVGREWTKLHYQSHVSDRGRRFIKEKVKILEELVQEKGHTHIILAGLPERTNKIKAALPKALQAKLVDWVSVPDKSDLDDVVAKTLSRFIENEMEESHDMVELLRQELAQGKLACAGLAPTLSAFDRNQVDTLVVDQDFSHPRIKEELVRLATTQGCRIETVKANDTLKQLGGVGCFLRFSHTRKTNTRVSEAS